MNRKREKRQQITAALLSAVMVFGMCGSELAAYTTMAQEDVQLQERDEVQGQEERTGQEESIGWEERTEQEQEKGTGQEEITDRKQEDISKVQGKEGREGSGEEKSEQEKEVFAGIDTDIAESKRSEPSEEEKQKRTDETKALTADASESEDERDKYTISFMRGINDLCKISTGNFADGETVEMTVDADSTIKGATLTYEWYKAENKEDPIEKAEKLNEDRPIFTTKKSGIKTEYYICRINDGKNTDDAVFTIKGDYLKVSRYVEDKPQGNSRKYLYFDFGTTVKLEVRAEQLDSRYQLAYQWQKESWYGEYQDIEGATESIYGAKMDDTDSMYYCDVMLKEGDTVIQTESYGFGLRAKDTLSGTCAIYAGENKYEETLDLDGKEYDWRISGEAKQGETVRLKVSANSSYKEGTICYTWYDDDSNELVTETAGEYSFVKNSVGIQYLRCQITDGVHERDVEFYIEKMVRIEGYEQINGSDTDTTFLSSPDEECELKVIITSKPEGNSYSYSWERFLNFSDYYEDESDYDGETEVIAGATGNSYKIPENIVGDNMYRCTVKDGDDEEKFLFWVYADSLETYPTVNQESGTSVDVVPGETVTLKVEAKSTYKNDGITYKWYKDWYGDKEVIGQGSSYTFETDDIIDDKGHCAERYTCEISDGFQTEVIWFYADTEEPEEPEKNSIEGIGLIDGNRTPGLSENSYYAAIGEVDYGKTCCLEVQMTSEPKSGAYEYQWGTYNESYGMVRKFSKERTFMAKHVSAYDVGDYWHDGTHFVCVVRDGEEERKFFFALNPCSLEVGQEINGKTASEIYIAPGETVELSVNAKSSFASADDIIYKWDREDTRTKGTAEGNKYTVTKSEKEVQKYVCRVEDGYDTEVFHFTLYSDTLSEPVCMIDGQSGSVLQCAEGTKHTLSVDATSSIGYLSYEWARIGENGENNNVIWFEGENTLEIERRDETETYGCKISDGMAVKTVYFHLSTSGESCQHEFQKIVTQATLNEDGSIVSRCKYCDKVESSAVIPYPKEIRLSSETFTYNGQMQKPTVTVIGSDGKVISALNYTVSYSEGSKEAGTYTADILFTGNYTGTISKKYTIKPVQNGTGGTTQKPKSDSVPAVGTVLKDAKTKTAYRVVKAGKTVEYKSAPNKKAASVNIPATVTINHVKYTVTSIAPNAFKNCKKLRKVTVGAKISAIGKQAFFGCRSLKTITVKSKSIKKIGSKAFKGIHKKAVIKVPKAKLKVYKKLLKKGGVGKNVKIKK